MLELSFFKRLRDLSALFLFNSHYSAYKNHISVDEINCLKKAYQKGMTHSSDLELSCRISFFFTGQNNLYLDLFYDGC